MYHLEFANKERTHTKTSLCFFLVIDVFAVVLVVVVIFAVFGFVVVVERSGKGRVDKNFWFVCVCVYMCAFYG